MQSEHDHKDHLKHFTDCQAPGWRSHCGHNLLRQHQRRRQQLRKTKDSEDAADAFSAYFSTLDERAKSVLRTASKLHTFINHRNNALNDDGADKGAKVRALQWRAAGSSPELSEQYNKFVIDARDGDVAREKQGGDVAELAEVLSKSGLAERECRAIGATLEREEYDRDAVLEDLVDADHDAYRHYAQSNLFRAVGRSKFFAQVIKRHLAAPMCDDADIAVFTLGWRRFLYCDYYKTWLEQCFF